MWDTINITKFIAFKIIDTIIAFKIIDTTKIEKLYI